MRVKCCPHKGEAAGCLLEKLRKLNKEGAHTSLRSPPADLHGVLALAATACQCAVAAWYKLVAPRWLHSIELQRCLTHQADWQR